MTLEAFALSLMTLSVVLSYAEKALAIVAGAVRG